MRKLLQILTVVLLVLSAAALVLGIMLFGKRQLLMGRTQSLEKGLMQVAALLETPADPATTPANFTEKDIGEVAAQEVTEPERAAFWKDYPLHLEAADKPLVTVRREELMNYYKVDPISGKPTKNPATGLFETEGDNTMAATIKRISDAATYELDQLNKTRHQLAAVREELVKTIEELNDGKQRQRRSLVQITDLNNQIATLEDEKRNLEGQVASLESEKLALEEDVAAKEQTIQTQADDIKLRDETITAQRLQIADLKKGAVNKDPNMIGSSEGLVKMEAGPKGKVVSVNGDWSYVVLQLNDVALAEIDAMRAELAAKNIAGFPTIDLFLKRGDSYISKVRLVQLKRDEKLAIADVLVDWQQAAVETGDIAFF